MKELFSSFNGPGQTPGYASHRNIEYQNIKFNILYFCENKDSQLYIIDGTLNY
jgi:hypothetical protein